MLVRLTTTQGLQLNQYSISQLVCETLYFVSVKVMLGSIPPVASSVVSNLGGLAKIRLQVEAKK